MCASNAAIPEPAAFREVGAYRLNCSPIELVGVRTLRRQGAQGLDGAAQSIPVRGQGARGLVPLNARGILEGRGVRCGRCAPYGVGPLLSLGRGERAPCELAGDNLERLG